VVVVSHDRAFLERVVADALIMDGAGTARRFAGGFAAWDRQRARDRGPKGSINATGEPGPATAGAAERRPKAAAGKSAKGKKQSSAGRSPSTLRRLIKQAEASTERLETERDRLTDELSGETDHARLAELGARLSEVTAELTAAEEAWMALAEEQEELGSA
jgi:ATP-binding cassette subfamily F protein uup